jgi:DNA repair exonuclease SbcCD ATPase subunit
VIAEGNETPAGPQGEPPTGSGGSEGRGWRGEGDRLAERRARRAAEAPEHLLTLRAEAAEATVRTLESHLATVQQRLREAESETRRLHEALVSEASSRERPGGETSGRTGVLERELHRARQREQVEHRARVEAEDRAHAIERDDRAEIDRLARRLSANERYVRALAAQQQELERRLQTAEERVREAEERARAAEQAAQAAAEHVRKGEAAEKEQLRERLLALERSADEVGRGLARERAERERAERLLAGMRRGQRRVEGVVRELGGIVARLRAQLQEAPAAAPAPAKLSPPRPPSAIERPSQPLPGSDALAARSAATRAQAPAGARTPERGAELESALEAAVERLRARTEQAAGQPPKGPGDVEEPMTDAEPAFTPLPGRQRAPGPASGGGADSGGGGPMPPAHAPSHKHSLSLIGRIRRARNQRRERR